MVCRGRNFGLGGLQKLLISLVNQARDLATHQVPRFGKKPDAVVIVLFDCRGTTVLLYKNAVRGSGGLKNVEPVLAKPVYCLFVAAGFRLRCHVSPVAGLDHPDLSAVAPSCQVPRRTDTLAQQTPFRQHYGCAASYPGLFGWRVTQAGVLATQNSALLF